MLSKNMINLKNAIQVQRVINSEENCAVEQRKKAEEDVFWGM